MMSDDSKTVEDTKKSEVTDDSCTVEFIEIVPLDRPSDDFHTSKFIYPVVEVKPEDLHEMKQEPTDENDNGDPYYYVKQEPADEYANEFPRFAVQVSSACTYSMIFAIVGLCLCLTLWGFHGGVPTAVQAH